MMKSIKLGAILAVLVASSVMAQSTMTYSLELGGNDHAAQWLNPSDCFNNAQLYPQFTPGSPTDGAVYTAGTVITWDVRVAVGGTIAGVNGVQPVAGAANMVASLELRDSANNLVAVSGNGAAPKWFSAVNDGSTTRVTACSNVTQDPQALAAFPVAWNAAATSGTGSNYARVIDALPDGGPLGGSTEAYWQYPSGAGFPAASTASAGTLVGIGAGYVKYSDALYQSGTVMAGIGVTSATSNLCSAVLGDGPVFEGQLDTTNMASGTYTLYVIPGTGNNVLKDPQDFNAANCGGTANVSFAQKADSVTGDTVTFVVEGGVPPANSTVQSVALFYAGSAWTTTAVPNVTGQVGNKVAKLPGSGPANFQNVTSYSRGINGIYVDIKRGAPADPPIAVTAADLVLRYGTTLAGITNDPGAPGVTVTAGGGGAADVDRVAITLPDNAVPNKNWLKVTVTANANSKLANDYVFYFGRLIGEVGDTFAPATRWVVNSSDYTGAYNNRSPAPIANRTITDVYDFDRSKIVNSTDYTQYGYNVRGVSPVDGLNVINP